MDWKKLESTAEEVVQKRGGIESVKEDAVELEQVATSDKSLAEKAKLAAKAVKEPGTNKEGLGI